MFFKRSRALQLTPQSMVGSSRNLNSCEPLWLFLLPKMKNGGATVECSQHYTFNFSDAQGQITPESVVVSGRHLNSSRLLCKSSLPARIKKIQLKMKELECSQDFSPL